MSPTPLLFVVRRTDIDRRIGVFDTRGDMYSIIVPLVALNPGLAPNLEINGIDAFGNQVERITVKGPKRSFGPADPIQP